jgi:tetratricopeptide (TPR) repeat protein
VRSQARAKSIAPVPPRAGALQPRAGWRACLRHCPPILTISGGLVLVVALATLGIWAANSPERLQSRAEAAAQAGDWTTALAYWHAVNATSSATSVTHLGEARAAIALGRAAQAETSLRRATAADASDPVPWRLLLKILRVEDRGLEAEQIGWAAYAKLRPSDRPELLRELTLSLLADLPDEVVRTTLKRWIDADPADLEAQIALWRRIAASPRAADPDRPALLAALESLLKSHPDHVGAREALIAALADTGDQKRGRVLLDSWPQASRDARYWRLRGRWDLEYDHRSVDAVTAFQTALNAFPHDWRSWYRLSRALRMLGRDTDSHQAAESVSRIRELLDPLSLGPRLDAAINHLDDATALNDLASLCDRTGLHRLADAWRALNPNPAPPQTTHSTGSHLDREDPQRDD